MPKAHAVAFLAEDLVGWERSLVAFLVEKERRSGSKRTVQGYSSMLQDFFGRAGLPPDQVTASTSSCGRTDRECPDVTPPPSPSGHAWRV